MYTVPGNCTPLRRQTTEGSPSRTSQAGGGSIFCYLGDMPSAANGSELSTATCVKTAWKKFKELLPVLFSRHLSFKTQGPCTCRLIKNLMIMMICHPVYLTITSEDSLMAEESLGSFQLYRDWEIPCETTSTGRELPTIHTASSSSAGL